MKFYISLRSLFFIFFLLSCNFLNAQNSSKGEKFYRKGVEHFVKAIKLKSDGPAYRVVRYTEDIDGKKIYSILDKSSWHNAISNEMGKAWGNIYNALDDGYIIKPEFSDIKKKCIALGISQTLIDREIETLKIEYTRLLRWYSPKFFLNSNIMLSVFNSSAFSSLPGFGIGLGFSFPFFNVFNLVNDIVYSWRGFEKKGQFEEIDVLSKTYILKSIDYKPTITYSPIRRKNWHLYLLSGGEYRHLLSAEESFHTDDWDAEEIRTDILDKSDISSYAFRFGLGFIRQLSGKSFVLIELSKAIASEIKIKNFYTSINTVAFKLSIGF